MVHQNLENRVENNYSNNPNIKPPYKSVGETILAETLDKYGIKFKYEKQILVEDKKPKDTEKNRLWYPDFYLENKGIIIEYAGRNDKDYLEGLEKRKETYEKMGLKVIIVEGYEIFENRHKRKDFEYNLLKAIEQTEKTGKSSRLKYGKLETNVVEGYNYKSAA